MWIQTGVTVRKRLSWVVTSVTLTFDLWPWPSAWTLLWSLVITPENFMMIRWWEHSKKGVTDRRTDRQTDGQTENTICRAAWSQLKITRSMRWLLMPKLNTSNHNIMCDNSSQMLSWYSSIEHDILYSTAVHGGDRVIKFNSLFFGYRIAVLGYYKNQSLYSQKTSHTSPSRASYGMSFVKILEKIDQIIMALPCTCLRCDPISTACIKSQQKYINKQMLCLV